MKVLCLFFTRGVSLSQWLQSGLFDREVLIYHAHIEAGYFSKVFWLTYGVDDGRLARELHETGKLSRYIEVIPCPRWIRFFGRFGSIVYSFALPISSKRIVIQSDVLKTNQMDGSIPALVCAAIWRRPVYVRTGYTLSRVVDNTFPRNWVRRLFAFVNEYLAFRLASASSVSSRFDREYIKRRYGENFPQPRVIGNYVDTELFSPSTADKKISNRILFVGRLSPEKNLKSTIAACAMAGISLDIIGQGEQKQELRRIAETCDADVRWLGVVPNHALPAVLYRYRYFILASLWEGMPKALLEAMSAGLVCIGNDTTGINEVIKDGVTGYLSPSASKDDIAETIHRGLAGDPDRVASAAMRFVRSTFSLDAVVAQEHAVFAAICPGKG